MSQHSKLIKVQYLWENVENGYYDSPVHEKDVNLFEYCLDVKALRKEFREDLAKLYEVTGHPKEKLLFDLSVFHAASQSTVEIWNNYSDFVDLLK